MPRKPEFPKRIQIGPVTVRVYQVRNAAGSFYEVRFRDWAPAEARWEVRRLCRTSKAEAISLAEQTAAALANGRNRRAALAENDARELIQARDVLQDTGYSVIEAARLAQRAWAERTVTPIEPVTVADAVGAYRAFKEREGVSALYAKDLRIRLGRFAQDFHVHVGDLTPAVVSRWMEGRSLGSRNWNNTRNTLVAFFNWLKLQRHLPADVDLLETVPRIRIRRGAVAIWTPGEMQKLLTHARPELIPFLALGAFAGLRSEEIGRLQWSAFRWEAHQIFVAGDVAKSVRSPRPRHVPILPALEAWLAPWRGAQGKVDPYERSSKAGVKLARALGLQWRRNGLRHSWISYRVAQLANVSQVSTEAGNSPADIHRSYLELTTKTAADQWFAIMPAASDSQKLLKLKFG